MSAEVTAVAGDDRGRGVRRSAFWLSLLALAIYGGFILMSVLRAG